MSELHGLVKHAVLTVVRWGASAGAADDESSGETSGTAACCIVNVAPPESPSDEDAEEMILASDAWRVLVTESKSDVRLVLSEEDWNMTNGLITGSHKVARKRVVERFIHLAR